jgi:hypothetical protein
MMPASWSCEANCFANNPQPDLQEFGRTEH